MKVYSRTWSTEPTSTTSWCSRTESFKNHWCDTKMITILKILIFKLLKNKLNACRMLSPRRIKSCKKWKSTTTFFWAVICKLSLLYRSSKQSISRRSMTKIEKLMHIGSTTCSYSKSISSNTKSSKAFRHRWISWTTIHRVKELQMWIPLATSSWAININSLSYWLKSMWITWTNSSSATNSSRRGAESRSRKHQSTRTTTRSGQSMKSSLAKSRRQGRTNHIVVMVSSKTSLRSQPPSMRAARTSPRGSQWFCNNNHKRQ